MRTSILFVAILVATSALAPAADWSVPLGVGTVAPGMMPAKYSPAAEAAPNCVEDFVVYGLNTAGVPGQQANLVAFHQLYKDAEGGLCGAGAPETLWAYAIRAVAGVIRTSPVLSLDGKKVAFVESGQSQAAFHVLEWAAGPGNGASPRSAAVPGGGNAAVLRTVVYSATATNLMSSPYVDYGADAAYVGSDDGKLYKITGVFHGAPALAGGPWPVTVSPGARLTAPSVDPVSRRLFVGDSKGYIIAVDLATGAIVGRLLVGATGAVRGGLTEPPILDPFAGTIFVFASNDQNGPVVVQASVDLQELARVHVGTLIKTWTTYYKPRYLGDDPVSIMRITPPPTLRTGTFDSSYYWDPNAGHLYVCGTAPSSYVPVLHRIGFAGGVLDPQSRQSYQLGDVPGAECSAISQITDSRSGNDILVLSLSAGCGADRSRGCLVRAEVNDRVTFFLEELPAGVTSAIVLDQSATVNRPGSYFTTGAASRSAMRAH